MRDVSVLGVDNVATRPSSLEKVRVFDRYARGELHLGEVKRELDKTAPAIRRLPRWARWTSVLLASILGILLVPASDRRN